MTHSPEDIARIRQRGYRFIHTVLDGIEARLDPPDLAERTALLRRGADAVALWAVCENSACRRARRCRRDGAACVAHFAPRLPDDVRACLAARLRGEILPAQPVANPSRRGKELTHI